MATITKTNLAGVLIVTSPVHGDDRGFFREMFRLSELEKELGFAFKPVQWNQSHSKLGTLRGVHIAPWHKLVTVSSGSVQQVVVDTRPDSPTFGQYVSIDLSPESGQSVFVSAGCGNAFLATSDNADYQYLVTDYWAADKELTVRYDDPNLNIAWQTNSPVLSERDLQAQTMRQVFPEKF